MPKNKDEVIDDGKYSITLKGMILLATGDADLTDKIYDAIELQARRVAGEAIPAIVFVPGSIGGSFTGVCVELKPLQRVLDLRLI